MAFADKYKSILLVFFASLFYFYFAYFIERTQFGILVFLWFSLFGFTYFLLKNKQFTFKDLAGIAIIFRLIFLFATPNLSQDFYRFIWDGNMILEGFNPYLYLPENFIQQGNFPIANAKELYLGMGELNGSHYTNYPPLNQLCFLIAALLGGKSIFATTVFLRIIIIIADVGILYFGKKLLEKLQIPIKNIFWYVLNPFIIIEMTGNLHFEPVMLLFFIFGLYKLHQQKWILAAILIACSVSVKLIPLLFLPLFYQWFIKNQDVISSDSETLEEKSQDNKPINSLIKLSSFYLVILGTTILFFLPFYSSALLENYSNSIGLWFRNFEFNASFYYIFREIGYAISGYNQIAVIGKIIPVTTILFLIIITFFRKNHPFKNMLTALLFGLCFYYFLSTTIHPWYVATPLLLCVFTNYKFPVVWSLVIIFSYQAYANSPWQENLWWVATEYIMLYSFLLFELINPAEKRIFNNFFKKQFI